MTKHQHTMELRATAPTPSRICLNMIVKNEAAIIGRCLESVARFIDYFIIHDTGSTDATVATIMETTARLGVAGEVHVRPFVDFGQSRTCALRAAQTSPVPFDVILLMDADMSLVADDAPDAPWRQALRDDTQFDAFSVSQVKGGLRYSNTRIVRKTAEARYVGSTHEYLAVERRGDLRGDVHFADFDDGGCKGSKYTRDCALLERDAEADPNNPRTWFYLARTYESLGKHALAAEAYRQNVRLANWDEERYYAKLGIGKCLETTGDQGALEAYVSAWEERPFRGEALMAAVVYCRDRKLYQAAIALLTSALSQDHTYRAKEAADTLFVEETHFRFQFLAEMGVVAYYAGKLQEGLDACDTVALEATTRRIPRGQVASTENNLRFYTRPLPTEVFTHHLLQPPDTSACPEYKNNRFAAANPGVCRAQEGGLDVNIRMVNYALLPDQTYAHLIDGAHFNAERPVVTINFRGSLDACTGHVSQMRRMRHEDTMSRCIPGKQHVGHVRGIEDVRLCHGTEDGHTYFIATTQDLTGTNQMVCGRFAPGGKDEPEYMSHLVFADVQSETSCQKNWVPFWHEGGLMCMYDACHVLRIDTHTGNCTLAYKHAYTMDTSNFRGSGPPVMIAPGEWLAVVHHVHITNDAPKAMRHYVHRWVLLDDTMRITSVSRPFRIRGDEYIEYVSGLALDRDASDSDARLVIAWGERDQSAYVTTCTLEDFRAHVKFVQFN